MSGVELFNAQYSINYIKMLNILIIGPKLDLKMDDLSIFLKMDRQPRKENLNHIP